MPRKVKIQNLPSRRYILTIGYDKSIVDGGSFITCSWYVHDRETRASTSISIDMDAYRQLKRVWRKSKEDFESVCRFMDFHDLFSTAGVELP